MKRPGMKRIERLHVDPVTIVDYVRGRLSGSRSAAVREHCHECADCGDQLAAVMLLRQGMERRPSKRWPQIAAVAVLVLAVGIGLALTLRGPAATQDGLLPAAAAPERTPAAVRSRASGVVSLPEPLADPQFQAFAGRSLAFVTEAEVGADLPAAAGDPAAALLRARAVLAEGDFAAAAAALAPFAERDHTVGTPLLGISLYLAGHAAEAAPVLVAGHALLLGLPPGARERTVLSATRYLLAWSLLERGRPDQAGQVLAANLEGLAADEEGDFFQQRSRLLASRIDAPGWE